MENIFFLILVAVVGLLRWLSQAAENKRNAEAQKRSAPPVTPAPQQPSPTEEERVRKFFEALGLPVETAPPPKVQPRPAAPKAAPADRKYMPIDPFPVPRGRVIKPSPKPAAPPPLPAAPAPAISVMPSPAEITVVRKSAIEMPESMTSAEFEVQDLHGGASPRTDVAFTSLAVRLATGQGLRDAIVLREIFGPPRSMQPFGRTIV